MSNFVDELKLLESLNLDKDIVSPEAAEKDAVSGKKKPVNMNWPKDHKLKMIKKKFFRQALWERLPKVTRVPMNLSKHHPEYGLTREERSRVV
jgi:hypothetical protein